MLLYVIIGFSMYAGLNILNAVIEVNNFLRICFSILRYGGLLGAIFGLKYLGTKYTWVKSAG